MGQLQVGPICVVIGRSRHQMVLAEMQEAVKAGARFIELRLDFLGRPPDLKRLLAGKACTLLATVRRPADGGRWSNTEENRRLLMRQAIVSGFDWIDIETDVIASIPRFGKVQRIVSYHNFQGIPPDLEKIHAAMCKQDADVVKIAVRGQSPMENLRLLDLVKGAPKPTVAFCMGDMGMPSRILGAKYGAPFTYAAFNPERIIAPGLPSLRDLQTIYHYDKIDRDTAVFGVLGDPVAHSLSPLIHNKALRHLGINAVYLPFRVPRSEFAPSLRGYERLPVSGYSVTIPHKEAAAVLSHTQDEAVTRTQAANTLVREQKGFAAYNTDYRGVLDTLHAAQTTKTGTTSKPFHDRTALILGAGGIARAVGFALKSEGAIVSITNRTEERGRKLAEEVGCKFVEWGARHNAICDILVNCTSVGMHPNVDDMPIHASFLRAGLLVFETVYTPETTLLVKEARTRQCQVITGVELFVRQASQQFKLFTGREVPAEMFRKVVKRAISPVTLKDDEESAP